MSTATLNVDFIIAGGGTAACILAGRLAKGDSTLSILVIEGGRTDTMGTVALVSNGIYYQLIK